MKKSFLFLLFVTCNLFALDDISIPYSFSPKDTIKASKFEANNSEIQTKFNKLNDSLELSFIRFSDLESGDSLLDKVRVDTLRVDNIRSNPNVDSISGDVRFTGAPTVNGVLTASGGVTGNVTGNVTGSISGGTVSGSTGTFSSTVSVDSIYSAKGINSAKRITGTDLQVSDSVIGITGKFTKVYSAFTGNLSGNVTGSISGGTVAGSTGTFSSRITGTDLQVSDSVRGVTGAFSGALSGLSLNLTNNLTVGGKVSGLLNIDSTKIGKAYFGTRPSNDYYWNLAFSARHTSNVSGNSWLIMNNAYYNSGWKYRESDGASLISLGSGTIDLRVAGTGTVDGTLTWNTALHVDSTGKVGIGTTSPDSTITVSGSGNVTGNLRCGKINTGLGNFEIGQDLQTTDAVTFSKASADTFRASKRIVSDSIYTRVSKVDSIQIGTSNAFSLYDGWYKEGSFACTLKTSDVTEQKIGTAYYTKIGNQVTIKLPSLTGTSNSTDLFIYCGEIPSITSGTYIAGSIGNIRSGTNIITGTFFIYNTGVGKYIRIFKYDYSDFATSGIKGIDHTRITYIN